MRHIFLLSRENILLSAYEFIALSSKKEAKLVDGVVVADVDFDFSRLAMTRKVYTYLFDCAPKDIMDKMKSFNWPEVYKKSFSIRVNNLAGIPFPEERAIADLVWNNIKDPKVNLSDAATKIGLIVTKNRVFVGILIHEAAHDFSKRKPDSRPEHHPTSMSPKLARTIVNLSGVTDKDTLTDPFCGTGGILIEAGLMGIKLVGHDIRQDLLDKAEINLKHYGIKKFSLSQKDATKIKKKLDFVVTDLPYGKGSSLSEDMLTLYAGFLHVLEKYLVNTAVVVFPNFIDHRKLIRKTKLKIKKEFSWYVHKSLTRNIVVLKR